MPLPVTEAQILRTATGGCSLPALPPPPPRSSSPHPATSHTLFPLPEVLFLVHFAKSQLRCHFLSKAFLMPV